MNRLTLCATRLPKLICVICCNWNCRAEGLQQLLVHIHRRGLLSRAHGSCGRSSRDQMSSILKPVVIFLLSGLPKEHSFPIEWFRITPQWNVFFGHLEFTSGANALCSPMGKKRNLGIIPLKPTAFFMPLRGQNKGFELSGVCVRVCVYETLRFS